MFFGATSFNQNIGSWEVGSVTDMNFAFFGVISFNQDLGNWTSTAARRDNMFSNSGMDCINYSATLIGWAANTSLMNVTVGAIGTSYGPHADAVRNELVSRNWTITDEGLDASCVSFNISPISDVTIDENTAYAGTGENLEFTSNFRSQWAGLDDAPRTWSFSASAPMGDKVGLGNRWDWPFP